LGFETLTLALLDERLISYDMLSEAEKAWLREYRQAAEANLQAK
jgi:hypothetical protein